MLTHKKLQFSHVGTVLIRGIFVILQTLVHTTLQ